MAGKHSIQNWAAAGPLKNVDIYESFAIREYTGTKEDLIAAGLAQPEQFPGQPGCGRTSTTFPLAGGQRLRIWSRGLRGYSVTLYRSHEEIESENVKEWRNFNRVHASGRSERNFESQSGIIDGRKPAQVERDIAFQRFMRNATGANRMR